MPAKRKTKKNVVKHVIKEGSRQHVVHWDTQGTHCSEPDCEINHEPKIKTEPKVGDKIYVPSRLYISRGSDDFAGGIATVKRVYKYMSGGDPKFFMLFDVLVGHKNRKFVPPKEFLKLFGHLQIPAVIYEGNLTDQFIRDVREDKYCLNEGVVCKGTQKSGAFRGGMWMCKIKTQRYLDRLKAKFGEEGVTKYGE